MRLETVNTIEHFLKQGNTIYLSHESMLKVSTALKADGITAFQIVPDNIPQFPERPYLVIYSGILTETNLKDYYKQKYEDEREAYDELYASVSKIAREF